MNKRGDSEFPVKRSVNIFILLLLIGYAAITAFMFFNQRALLYFPTPEFNHSYERFSLSNDGHSIEVIVLNSGNSRALLYFGGNGESVVMNADLFSSRYPNTTVYLFNYRGYGGSSGSPEEKAIYSDAIALYDKVVQQHGNIVILGRSLGSGVATYVAANRLVQGLILVTPYDSIVNLAKQLYPLLPVSMLLMDRYDSISRAGDIHSDILFLIAESDEIIPRVNTERLINSFEDDKVTVHVIPASGHNTLSNHSTYHQSIQSFLSSYH